MQAGNARLETRSQEHLDCLCLTRWALAVRSCSVFLPLELLLLMCSGGNPLLPPPHHHHSCYLPHPLCAARGPGTYLRDSHHVQDPSQGDVSHPGRPHAQPNKNAPQQLAPGKKRGQRKMASLSSNPGFGSARFALISLSPLGRGCLVTNNRKDCVAHRS